MDRAERLLADPQLAITGNKDQVDKYKKE